MTVNQASIVVGVFADRALAEEAMEELSKAGFANDQIRYASANASGTGRFFEDIKGMFTGAGTGSEMMIRDLTAIGLSDDEAHYYANEYQKGHAVVAVKAPGREQEAMVILQKCGAHNYNSQPGTPPPPSPEPIDQEPTTSTSGTMPKSDATDQAPSPPSSAQIDYTSSSPASTDQEQLASDEVEQDVNAMHQPDAQHPMPQPFTQPEDSVPESSHEPEEQPVQENQHLAPTQAASRDYEAELQDVRKQLEETQRQLEDARAQLQAAKEQHAQMQAQKQREAELQDARKQLEDSQAQLQATLEELRALQSQMGQPV